MQITVNGQPHTTPEGQTLRALLGELGLPAEAVAVALNLEVVPRAALGATALRPGDRVEVVRAVGGG